MSLESRRRGYDAVVVVALRVLYTGGVLKQKDYTCIAIITFILLGAVVMLVALLDG